jgi:hypothetical protein
MALLFALFLTTIYTYCEVKAVAAYMQYNFWYKLSARVTIDIHWYCRATTIVP